jgi:anion-transporting  ArsA/GET3 family ATPase
VTRHLFDYRLVIVTGKGGTGKTSVAAALGLAAASAGKRVLVAEMGSDEAVLPLFEAGGAPAGYPGREVLQDLDVMHVDPFAALAEYLVLQLGGRLIVDRVVANQGFRQLMNGSPGWRELITLGKLWHVEQMQRAGGGPKYDLIVVDAPATGHGVAFLNVPRVVVSAVRAGPLRRHSQAVEDLIEDSERTLLLPVTLAEELPTRETVELVTRLRDEVGVRVDRLVVNAVAAAPFPAGLQDLDVALRALPADTRFGHLPPASVLADCASFLRARHALNQRYVRLVSELTDLPVLCLPMLVDGVNRRDDLVALAQPLLAPPESPAR